MAMIGEADNTGREKMRKKKRIYKCINCKTSKRNSREKEHERKQQNKVCRE